MSSRVLCVRLDATGDVLLAGPAIRAVAASGATVDVLAGPRGGTAARLLPGVEDVLVWQCPWVGLNPSPADPGDVAALVATLRDRRYDAALVFTSFHQSPLPTALLLRLAGVGWVGGISEDYPGALLDLRHRLTDDRPESERALSLALVAGYRLPAGDDGRLAVRRPLPDVRSLTGAPPYVVLHPGTSAPARAWPPDRFAAVARLLHDAGHRVVVTGAPAETALTGMVAADVAVDLGGRTDLAQLAAVLSGAEVVVVGNTGPAHLAAAVGTPVVSLFAPTVPAARWAPYGVPRVLLGDQHAPCRDSRVTTCSVPGHPCLSSVTADEVVRAVAAMSRLVEKVV
ncbi:glycosyltransferase family 9 protein [Jiangella ureilytica]|uniref:Glycosyltransferase family 9 protein n=1 Tax=Jiangella ureilytica TaxID=2530374 RepID=A0A4R4RQE9_9ACTN|nr:glycosyltransferase family 9 protein [Jiangella ureilytica]TDC52141.1 glycosyltransferase family 9 protein [Jiangella ureilytica]